ncbi:MAG: hypothetical protein WAT71_02110 [Ignavibacteria bacterium]
MGKILDKKDLKPLIKETLCEMIRDNNEEIKEMIIEAIEDIALANAVREGRKGEYVRENQILKILEK